MRRRVRKPAPAPPLRRLTVSIEAIGAQGDGLARDETGEPVFAPLTAPGDRAVVAARGQRARLAELLAESPHRAPPPCPHYGACGGCALQHVTGDFYRGWKRDRVSEALARAGLRDVAVGEVIETPVAGRRRATFAAKRLKHAFVFGFNARHSSEIIAVDHCVILHPDLLAALPAVRAMAQMVPAEAFDVAVTLCRNGLDIDIQGKVKEPRGRALLALTEAADAAQCVRLSLNGAALLTIEPPVIAAPGCEAEGIFIAPPPGSFLQASEAGEAALAALVRDAAGGARKIADLFAGCGAFTLPLARAATLFAVDSDAGALAALAEAARSAQSRGAAINPVRTETRNLFERPLTAGELSAFGAVVFDPPRAGAREQAEELARSTVPLVVGVSCNPATFARDAAILAAGGYRLGEVTPVDQFVYSPHIELVGVFERT